MAKTIQEYEALAKTLKSWDDAHELVKSERQLYQDLSHVQQRLSASKRDLGYATKTEIEENVIKLRKRLASWRKQLPLAKCGYCPTMTPGGFTCASCEQDFRDDPDAFK